MDTASSSRTSERGAGRLRAWIGRQPLWIAQIIAILITWALVLTCVSLFVLATGGTGG